MSRDSASLAVFLSLAVALALFSLCSASSSAEGPRELDNLAFFFFNSSGGASLSLDSAFVLNFMDYYHYGSVQVQRLPEGYVLVFEDASGAEVLRHDLSFEEPVFYDDVMSTARIKVFDGSSLLLDSAFSFCDRDGVCEPCAEHGCSVSENALSCSDCSSGGRDRYCDGFADGVCDPDCARDMDSDCGLLCRDLKGFVCGVGQGCVGGSRVSSSDSDDCCVGGVCADIAEYVSFRVASQDQPALTLLKEGGSASAVLDYGVADYCVDRLDGGFCAVDERCEGSVVEYYPGSLCCVGSCEPYSAEEFGNTPDFVAAVKDEVKPLSAREIEQLYPAPPAEAPDDRFDGSAPPDSMADDLPTVSERFAKLGESILEVSTKVDPIKIAAVVLGVLLLLFVVLAVFKRFAARDVPLARDAAPKQPAQKQADLQQSIDSLAAKGYDYAQMKVYLVSQGFDPAVVSSEIRKNYDFRASRRQR